MHEELKIAEAEYFLTGIAGAADDPNATRYQASAFLTAAHRYAVLGIAYRHRCAWHSRLMANDATTGPISLGRWET